MVLLWSGFGKKLRPERVTTRPFEGHISDEATVGTTAVVAVRREVSL
jgi:hypothetical protein